jgi:Tol biopolymer transport system component
MKYTHHEPTSNYFCISVSLLLIVFLAGCSSLAVPLQSTDQIQITYIENQENSGSLYAADITCLSSVKVCTGEPLLLFQTLTMPNSAQAEPKGLLTDYSWSPTGKEIVLVSAGDLLIGSISRNMKKWLNITNSPQIDEWKPKWSSDGDFIYYIECLRDSSGSCIPKLARIDRLGNNKLYLLSNVNTSIDSYDVSPNDREVIYTSMDKQRYEQVYKANLDGTNIYQLTSGNFNNRSPSFSPNRKEIVFVRSNRLDYKDTKPEFDVVLKDLETGIEKKVIEKHAGDAFTPFFLPDGKWIAFTFLDENLISNIFLTSLDKKDLIQLTQNNEGVLPAWRLITR